ncbi:hypothetical protein [Rheinheimera sp.]|uniref:hypothetical protein n=1 Tax=Rheinheimera sp. TaxID=1869214 RepID=UPI003D2A34F0
MKNRWIGYCVALLSVSASAQEYPRELTFSTGEQQIWQLTMQRPVAAREQVSAELNRLDVTAPAEQAFLWAQRCRFALQAGDKAALDNARVALKQLEAQSTSSEFAGSAAGYKCQQLSKFSAGESMDTRQLSFLAYHSLTERDTPTLHAWIGLDYARDALQSGFADSAASAVALVLSIARDNRLPQLEADSLAVQAEVQTALGHYPDALRSIHQALALQTDSSQQQQLQLTQAGILLATGRLQQAQALYQTLWQQQSVPAGLALLALYLQQSQIDLALPLSRQLQQLTAQSGDREWIAISGLRHAMTLLAQGKFAKAQAQFADGSGWLSQHRLALYLPEQQRWVQLLAQQSQQQAAFDALQQSLRLQRQFDAEQHQTQAQLSSTLLIAEQRSRELKLVDVQQQLSVSRAEIQTKEQQVWGLTVLCAVLALLLVLLLWRRFYR